MISHSSLPASTPDAARALSSLSHSTVAAGSRVLFFDHSATLGGGEIALLNLVENLDRDRFVPIVALCAEGPLADRLRSTGVETHIVPLARNIMETQKDSLGGRSLLRLRDAWHIAEYVVRLARFIQRQRVCLVHTNSLKADIIGGIAARLSGTPVVWHVRDRIEQDYLPRSVVTVFRRLCRIIPHYVVANSEATLRTLALNGTRPCGVVYSGIDVAEYRSRATTEVEDETLPVESGADSGSLARDSCKRIGLIGRISPWKGQHIFLKAAAIVHRQNPAVQFQIIGAPLHREEAYEREIRGLVRSLKLEDCVEFTGFRSDVPALIADLDIVVHASTSGEPFGQVVVQGMAAGKPVVATDGGGIPEIVIDGETGLLVPMGDAEAMADAIKLLLDDPTNARMMGQRGYERVQGHFTIEKTAEKIALVYDKILAKQGTMNRN